MSSTGRGSIALACLVSACGMLAFGIRARSQSPSIQPTIREASSRGGGPGDASITVAPHALVASSNRAAAQAGVDILRSGGNAVDAAVAVGFALAVTYPEAGNLGGGGYMIIRMADGRTAALDYRETAPALSSRDMYLDSMGRVTRGSVAGRSSAGVPGAVAGLTAAHKRFGSLPLSRVLAPAIKLAQGMVVDSALPRSLAAKETTIKRYAGGAVFFADGKPPAPGSRFSQPDLARTLKLIAANGADGFYRGTTARLIVAEMQRECPDVERSDRARHGCGLITATDLEQYKPAWRRPVSSSFRGYRLLTMPPSSSGGVTLGETLNILDGFRSLPAFGTAEYIHLFASAFQRAFTDRNALLGDPDYVRVPVNQLLSRSYAARLRATIDRSRPTPTALLKMPPREGMETTHYSVVDGAGNAVSTTTTLNSLYGSGVFVAGAGFFLNNTMDDFASQPGAANQFGLVQGEANAIAPGKRMLSAMTPTIVLDPQERLFMVLGARGGPRIITSVAQVIVNVLEHRMSLAEAVAAPRIHYQALPDSLRVDAKGFDTPTLDQLRSMGYAVDLQGYIGGSVVAIRRVRGGWEGMDDTRGFGGGALGY
ncbi:MAG TPA: gamma-glutamyltransferase [Gemmatimonadaceae bacterium]|nr:gamma-glutamyltransferase [Gemmatimonadaceae bacterium]